ncbi:neuropeptide FF receptor 1 like 1 isoform X1 [Tachysurus fulvidraco]|uniref:neuropeptide FF receptor 1 like 1 isoform X1 n=2 Tax=Tachysurus fulvidraco TaxID=1234273 RepID=UPI001FF00B44|nr:neuropeptide FF receptor 1 like 1 isoform X1 [Tachysurus fulvidraco]
MNHELITETDCARPTCLLHCTLLPLCGATDKQNRVSIKKVALLMNHSNVNRTMDVSNVTLLPYYMHSAGMALSYVLLYTLVCVVCVAGNSLVCVVVLTNRNMRSVTNLFILNLAISDLFVGVVCVPTTLIDSLISGWPFSQMTCTLSNLIQGMSVSASVFTLVTIAVDRYTGIVYPFRHRLRPVTALFAIFFIWLLAFAIIFPSSAMLTVIQLDDTYMVHENKTYPLFVCFEDWPRSGMRRIYTTAIFVHVYLLPLVLISIMYGCIAFKLSGKLRQNSRRLKVIKMLIMVAVLFMVLWLPLWTLMLLTDYQELDVKQIDFLSSYLFPVAHWLAFFNSAINPIVYGFFNENFQRGFQAAVSCRRYDSQPLALHCRRFANKVSNNAGGPSGGQNKVRCVPTVRLNPVSSVLLEDVKKLPGVKHVNSAWVE